MLSNDPGREKMTSIVAAALAVNPGVDKIPQRASVIVEALIADDGGDEHIVMIGDDNTFTMKHPLPERFAAQDGLFECPLTNHAARLAQQGAFGRGTKHRLYVGDYGIIMWDEIAPDNPGSITAKS